MSPKANRVRRRITLKSNVSRDWALYVGPLGSLLGRRDRYRVYIQTANASSTCSCPFSPNSPQEPCPPLSSVTVALQSLPLPSASMPKQSLTHTPPSRSLRSERVITAAIPTHTLHVSTADMDAFSAWFASERPRADSSISISWRWWYSTTTLCADRELLAYSVSPKTRSQYIF